MYRISQKNSENSTVVNSTEILTTPVPELEDKSGSSDGAKGSGSGSGFDLEDLFLLITSMNQNMNNINELKAILKHIIESMVYVFLINGFFMFAFSIYNGGMLIYHISKIPDINEFDHNLRLAIRLLSCTIVLIFVINLFGLVLFNTSRLGAIIGLFQDTEENMENRLNMMQIWFMIVFHLINYICLSLMPILFVYTMIIFRQVIRKLLNTYATGKE